MLAPETGLMVWTGVILALFILAGVLVVRLFLRSFARSSLDRQSVSEMEDLRRRLDALELDLHSSEAERTQISERLQFAERLLESRDRTNKG